MNNHPIGQEELMAYLDGELPNDRSLLAVAHLEHCPECQQLAADLRNLSQKLMDWEVESPTPRISSAIHAALDRQREPKTLSTVRQTNWREKFMMRRWAWAGALAAVCLVVGLGSITTLNRSRARTRIVAEPQAFVPDSNGLFHGLGDHAEKSLPVDGQPLTEQQSKVAAGARSRSLPLNGRQFTTLQALTASPGPYDKPAVAGPMIVRTAALTLTTKDFEAARSSLEEILRRRRGYIGDLTINTASGAARNFTTTLRVPADQLDATIADLRKLGRVESESQSGEEVTAQYVDLEARLDNARHTEQRLTDLLRQRTGKLSDVLAVETEIDRVRGDIERMEAERKSLAGQVSFATINATVSEEYKEQIEAVPPSTSTRLRNAAVEGYRTLVDGVISVVLFLFSYGPSLLIWLGLLFFPARILWRKFTRSSAPGNYNPS